MDDDGGTFRQVELSAGMVAWRPTQEEIEEAMKLKSLAEMVGGLDDHIALLAERSMEDGVNGLDGPSVATIASIGTIMALARLVAWWSTQVGIDGVAAALDQVVTERVGVRD